MNNNKCQSHHKSCIIEFWKHSLQTCRIKIYVPKLITNTQLAATKVSKIIPYIESNKKREWKNTKLSIPKFKC